MSLKAFHVVFITASILLAFGFGAWLLKQYFGPAPEKLNLVVAVASFAVGLGLIGKGMNMDLMEKLGMKN